MGCCTNLLDLYQRLGVLERIEWHDVFYWNAAGGPQDRRDGHGPRERGRIDRLRADRLPAPFHLARSLRRMSLFSRAERREISRAMWRIIRIGTAGRHPWAGRTFAEFLRSPECAQGESVIRRFWNTIIVSACNLDVDRVSAAYAMQVFQDSVLAGPWPMTMGLPRVPLGELYDPAVNVIKAGGGDIFLGLSAKAIAFDGSRVTGVVTDKAVVDASAVIAAVPPDRLDRLLSGALRSADQRLARLDRLTMSPILGVHLYFDAPVMTVPHLVLVDPPHGVQWLFKKGQDARGRHHVHAVISAADGWMELDEAAIAARVVADLHAAIPAARGLMPVECRAIKEKRATFAAVPGVDELRPPAAAGAIGQDFGGGVFGSGFVAGGDAGRAGGGASASVTSGGGGVRNLYLAGDWCDTGWPATMEGAVRSGYAAAAAITGQEMLVPDLPRGLLARCLGLR
jgi:zeta-carotene desaturase